MYYECSVVQEAYALLLAHALSSICATSLSALHASRLGPGHVSVSSIPALHVPDLRLTCWQDPQPPFNDDECPVRPDPSPHFTLHLILATYLYCAFVSPSSSPSYSPLLLDPGDELDADQPLPPRRSNLRRQASQSARVDGDGLHSRSQSRLAATCRIPRALLRSELIDFFRIFLHFCFFIRSASLSTVSHPSGLSGLSPSVWSVFCVDQCPVTPSTWARCWCSTCCATTATDCRAVCGTMTETRATS